MSEPVTTSPVGPAAISAVIGLYDLILQHIDQAAQAAKRGDYDAQFTEVMQATKIINGLNNSLDMGQGGTVAQSLRDMYKAVTTGLMNAVGRQEGAECCEKIGVGLRQTRDAWVEVAKLLPQP